MVSLSRAFWIGVGISFVIHACNYTPAPPGLRESITKRMKEHMSQPPYSAEYGREAEKAEP